MGGDGIKIDCLKKENRTPIYEILFSFFAQCSWLMAQSWGALNLQKYFFSVFIQEVVLHNMEISTFFDGDFLVVFPLPFSSY